MLEFLISFPVMDIISVVVTLFEPNHKFTKNDANSKVQSKVSTHNRIIRNLRKNLLHFHIIKVVYRFAEVAIGFDLESCTVLEKL